MSSRISTGNSRTSSAFVVEETLSKNKLMKRQLAEFQEKSESGASNFSKDTLHYWLKLLTEKPEVSYQNKFINSLSQLRKLVEWITSRYKNSKKRDRDGKDFEMIRYFEWFFGYIQYLRELYQEFHNRIYEPLFDYFYDDEDDVRDDDDDGKVTPGNGSRDSGIGNETGRLDSAFLQPSVTKVLVELSREFSDIDFKLDNKDLHNTARKLYELIKHWRQLIENDSDIDPKLYGKESLEEVAEYTNIGNFRQFLRLIPDVLLKTKKAVSLAEHWMEIDEKKLKEIDTQLGMVEEIQTRMELRVIEVLRKIQQHEGEFNVKSDELQMLLMREDRSNELNVKLSFIQGDINILQKRLDKACDEGREIIDKIEELKRTKQEDSDEYGDYTNRYDDNKRYTFELVKSIEMEEYKYRLVEEDMFVELEVKPSMVRYTNQVEEDCERIEKWLEDEKRQKRKLEHALKPLSFKTGRDVSELLNLCMHQSVTPASTDIMASSAASLHKLLNSGKGKGLASVNEDDEPELTHGGAVTRTLERKAYRPTQDYAIEVPDKNSYGNDVDYTRRTTVKITDENDNEKENEMEGVLSSPTKSKVTKSRLPVPVKRNPKHLKGNGDKSKNGDGQKDSKSKKKEGPTKQSVATRKKAPTKNVAKKPIVKPPPPANTVKNNDSKKQSQLVKPPPPPGKKQPGVELPWYRRKNVFQRNNNGNDDDVINSRENLEHMYRNAAARQNAPPVPDGVSGRNLRLQRRETSKKDRTTGLGYL
ncbi:uncharacterized protein LOC100377020 [Saccoglossus kowalevskii]